MITIEHLVGKSTTALPDHIYSDSEITSQNLKDVLVSPLLPNSETTRGCFPFMMAVTPQSLGLLFHSCMMYDKDY